MVYFSKDVKVPVKVRRTLSSVGTSSSNNMTEISKHPWCDHRDLMKERAAILDKSRQFLAIKCDHQDDRKKLAHKAFLHINSLDCLSKGVTPEIRQK